MTATEYLEAMLANVRAMRRQVAAMRAELEGAETAEETELQECEA